jgi:hypothetical protein
MTEINTSFDVYVLGDVDTSKSLDMLAEKAAEHGAVIAQTFAFAEGEAAGHDDLTEVDAVVEALSHAIATRTDIWLPFWLQDLCRETHLRRLSLTLQRHGLNLLLGPHLEPCPVEGGINEIDAALRSEVRAVFALDDAALAAAGMRVLGDEIVAALAQAAPFDPVAEPPFDWWDSEERHFSTAEAAALLGRSSDWVSRGLREKTFVYADGSPVEPVGAGRGGRRRFTGPMVRAMAFSAYRRGTLSPTRLQEVLAELAGGLR